MTTGGKQRGTLLRTLYCSNVICTRISPLTISFSNGRSLCQQFKGQQQQETDHILEPLVNSAVVDQNRFDLEGPKEEMIGNAIINVEGD